MTLMLIAVFDGDVTAVRTVWEAVHGIERWPPASVPEAAGRLHDTLRGLHLVSGCPTDDEISRRSGQSRQVVRAVLCEGHLPDWPSVAGLAAALSVDPELVRPLWLDLIKVRAVDTPRQADVAGQEGSK
ncbi:hypothetical protein ACFWNG_04930 [Streptomyces sp. NPDC058391]|uniref:hypothetical protein n=1 Tax=Streptomyces sp. NPDC058391 TaxID=3346476 RepID=UPI003668BCBB